MKTCYNAFTLAEVLITLAIVGVVAAMTIPTLINQTNGLQYKTACKKAISTITQGITASYALDDMSFAEATPASPGDKTSSSVAGLLSAHMNIVKVGTKVGYGMGGSPQLSAGDADDIEDSANNTTVFFNDGSVFQFQGDAAECSLNNEPCRGFIDVNGLKGPNKVVACSMEISESACIVPKPTDIYPVIFYDQSIAPNSSAARSVLHLENIKVPDLSELDLD